MEHLLGSGCKLPVGRADDRQVQRWGWRILLAGNLGWQTYLLSLHVVEDHAQFRAVGTSVFHRWREDLGNQLDEHFRKSKGIKDDNTKRRTQRFRFSDWHLEGASP